MLVRRCSTTDSASFDFSSSTLLQQIHKLTSIKHYNTLHLLVIINHLLTFPKDVFSVLWRCWLGGRKGTHPVKNWVVGFWRGYQSGARWRFAYGPADVTVTHYLLHQKIPIGFTFLVPAVGTPRYSWTNVCWTQQLVSSQALASSTKAYPVFCMMNCTGLVFLSECSTSWQWWFTGAFKTKHQSTWLTAASQCLMSPVDSTYDLPVVTSWPFLGLDELHSAIGPSLLGVRWHGTHCRTISVIHRTAVVALGPAWSEDCSFHEILVYLAQ